MVILEPGSFARLGLLDHSGYRRLPPDPGLQHPSTGVMLDVCKSKEAGNQAHVVWTVEAPRDGSMGASQVTRTSGVTNVPAVQRCGDGHLFIGQTNDHMVV